MQIPVGFDALTADNMRMDLSTPVAAALVVLGAVPLSADVERQAKVKRTLSLPQISLPVAADENAGLQIVNPIGDAIGKITKFVAGQKSWLQFAVVETGGRAGMGGKSVLVPLDAIEFDQDGTKMLILDASVERLKDAPAFDPNEKIPAAEVYAYWGVLVLEETTAPLGAWDEDDELPE